MTEPLAHIRTERSGGRLHVARHLVEMLVAMQIGMMAGPYLFALALGTSVGDFRRSHDVAFALVMGVGMTVPMVAWMLYRGHSWRSAAEMTAVMIGPALPLVALKLADVVTGPVAGSYMCVSTLAMIALIVYRRSEYRVAAGAHAQIRPGAMIGGNY